MTLVMKFNTSVLFFWQIFTTWPQKNGGANDTNGAFFSFFWVGKNGSKSPLSEEKNLKLSNLDNRFQHVTTI